MIPGFSMKDMLSPQKKKNVNGKALRAALSERMFPFRKSTFQKNSDAKAEAAKIRQLSLDSLEYQEK